MCVGVVFEGKSKRKTGKVEEDTKKWMPEH